MSKSNLTLNPNEEIIVELEAELWATSSNVIAKFIGFIWRMIALIFGIRRKGYLVITNQRVVEISHNFACWVFNTGREIKYVLPSSIKELGYIKEGTFCGCFCQAYHLFYESYTQSTSILLSNIHSDQEALKLVDTFYRALNYK